MRGVLDIMLALVHIAVATQVISADTKEIMRVTGTSVVTTDILVVFGATLGIMLVLVYMAVVTRVISADTREIILVTGTSAATTDILVEIKYTSVLGEITTVALVDIILGITTIIIVMAIQLHPTTLIAPLHHIDPGIIRPVPTQLIRQAIPHLLPTSV